MKTIANLWRRWPVVLALGLGVCTLGLRAFAAEANDEQQCLKVLQSDGSLTEKDAACARLKRIGTAASVPALAALLTDEQLSHSARYALESMNLPEAEQALIGALDKTSGLTRVGLIQSLAMRRDPQALPALARLLREPETLAATAAAYALGALGSPEAAQALQDLLSGSAPVQPAVHDAAVDGLLRCGNRWLESGSNPKALAVFEQLYQSEKPERVRVAAYRGIIRASGAQGLRLMTDALTGPPTPSQTAALQLVHDVPIEGAAQALAELLPQLEPVLRAAVIGGLGQRGDAAALPQISTQVASDNPMVRLAAIKVLGPLGDASTVSPLAGAAASGAGAEQTAARQSLLELRGAEVTKAMLTELKSARPEVAAELARALGGRGDRAAMPGLLAVAGQGSGTSHAALSALSLLARNEDLKALAQLVLDAKNDAARSEAATALSEACQRLQSDGVRVEAGPIVQGLAKGPVEARIALLPVCGGLLGPEPAAALRAALHDSNAQVRTAALRALCATSDADLLPDLLAVARENSDETLRTLAISGCVRLTQDDSKLSPRKRAESLGPLLATSLRADQKRMVLAGLAEIPASEALKLALPLLADAEVKNEAAAAVTKIAQAVPGPEAEAALKQVVASIPEGPAKQAAETGLREVQANGGYLTQWQVAGPYRQAGKDYRALFDQPFPPEPASGSPTPAADWRALPGGGSRPWAMDLLKALGGEQCVAYTRTWVYCERGQPVRLELGSDDGVKVWLNDKLVHANNAARAVQPGADKFEASFRKGWNGLLLKVTQNNAGWGFCVRLLKTDGAPLEGLRISAENPANPAAPAGK